MCLGCLWSLSPPQSPFPDILEDGDDRSGSPFLASSPPLFHEDQSLPSTQPHGHKPRGSPKPASSSVLAVSQPPLYSELGDLSPWEAISPQLNLLRAAAGVYWGMRHVQGLKPLPKALTRQGRQQNEEQATGQGGSWTLIPRNMSIPRDTGATC